MTPVRRSSRANKGQNARLQQQEQEAMEEALRLAEEEAERERIKTEEGHVLCLVCGTTDNNYDEEEDTRDMIQCETCKTWQHNECMLSNPKRPPKHYRCSLCDEKNKHYKTLKYTMDPEETKRALAKDDLRKAKKQASVRTLLKDLEDVEDDDNVKDETNIDSDVEHHATADEEEDEGEVSQSEGEKDADEPGDPQKKPLKRSNSDSAPKKQKSSNPHLKKRKTSTPPQPQSHSETHPAYEEIEQKAREAVTKRFESMFVNLLKDQTIEGEEGTVEEISLKWSKKLEDDLYEAYHDHETKRLTKDYKEVSTRIFVNLRDAKNLKLRSSIINRDIPFNKLVRMPVNELLNPDLKKEKEEAIKESMSLATLEKSEVSNIRRTHKGDILLEKEDVTPTAQFDFNVGMHIDREDDDEKFIKSDNNVSITARKHSLYDGHNGEGHGQDDDDNDEYNDNRNTYDISGVSGPILDGVLDDTKLSGITATTTNSKATNYILDDEDDDLAAILGETKKKIEQTVESYDPMATKDDLRVWNGQTIFTGVTNFAATLHYKSTTLTSTQFGTIANSMVDPILPMEIEGRLDALKADAYLTKVAITRKLVLLELKPELENDPNFRKLFDYFSSKAKFGVVRNKQKFVKDCYILPYSSSVPRFMRDFPGLTMDSSNVEARLFLVFVIRQELIQEVSSNDDYDPTTAVPPITKAQQAFDFLSALSPAELAIVNRIFDTYPRARTDPVFLIQQLQQMMGE